MNALAVVRLLYAAAVVMCGFLLVRSGWTGLGRHVVAVAVLVGIAICGQCAQHELRTRITGFQFDMDLGLALVAVVLAGPVAGVLVGVIPEVIFLTRRRAIWRLWAVGNLVSIAAAVLAGSGILDALLHSGVPDIARLCVAGIAMLIANYVFARLILAVGRDGARPLDLLRNELLAAWRPEFITVGIGVASAVLIPDVGILALAGFATLIYIPQIVAVQLTRAPSVARLSIDDAAQVYRNALADELAMRGETRRELHCIDALVEHRPLGDAPANPMAFIKDALLVTICRERPATQKHFRAPLKVQVVLVSRRWAELTARCTPALNHEEAMTELRRGSLAQDAPLALIAASRIVGREHALTEHIAGVPRLHRVPLPRPLRRGLLPRTLAQIAG